MWCETVPTFRTNFLTINLCRQSCGFPVGSSHIRSQRPSSQMLGEGVFSAAFDELNFYPIVNNSKRLPEGGTYDEATVLYNRLSRRIRSRMNQRGRLPGHLW